MTTKVTITNHPDNQPYPIVVQPFSPGHEENIPMPSVTLQVGESMSFYIHTHLNLQVSEAG